MALKKKGKTKDLDGYQKRNTVLTPEEKEELFKYIYPFENIAMEGGGSKGSAYVGTIRVLEELGVWQNIKRFSGASAGAIVCMWAALGYDSYEIEKLLSVDLDKKCYDARLGAASLLPNLKKNYGWNPGKRLLRWFGKAVADKLGDPDATFADLYSKTGRELCVIAVNVNALDCVYCHVKTTPNMPIRVAVRMSSAIPGVLAPVKYTLHGAQELFCDGGLICNYPIHVFDGWYLSLKAADTFLSRTPDLNDIAEAWDTSAKFGTEANRKTIGILLYSESEQEIFKVQLNERTKKYIPNPTPIPNTKLARQRWKEKEKMTEAAEKHEQLYEALTGFLSLLSENDDDDSGTISREELKDALDKAGPNFSKKQRELLFGKDISADELFDSLDANGDGEITMYELTMYAEQHGMEIRKLFRGFESRKITDVSGYFDAIIETLLLNMKRIFMRGDDLHRTIGIDTAYLDTLDFAMEPADKEFLLQQGKTACIAFLRYHIDKHKLAEKAADDLKSEDKEGVEQRKEKKKKPHKFFSTRRRFGFSVTRKISRKGRKSSGRRKTSKDGSIKSQEQGRPSTTEKGDESKISNHTEKVESSENNGTLAKNETS